MANPSPGGARVADSLSTVGRAYATPSDVHAAPASDGGGGSMFDALRRSLCSAVPLGEPVCPAPSPGAGPDASATKLPTLAGNAAAQAWESLPDIPARDHGACPEGLRDLGVVLFVHDVDRKRQDFAGRSDADRWQAVHTVTDLIQALRTLVGTCGFVRGIMISAHGGWATSGGFRMGEDFDGAGQSLPTNGDGEIQTNEANDFVSTAAQAATFGRIIRGAFHPGRTDGFIAVEACDSAGPSNAFLTALRTATNQTTIGSVDAANVGGNWWSGAWWEADQGRAQVNRDGTVHTSAATSGTGVWRPF